MDRQQKIALIRSVIKVWGSFSPIDYGYDIAIIRNDYFNYVITYVYFSSVGITQFRADETISSNKGDDNFVYDDLSDEVLDELVSLCRKYNELMLEQEQE